MTLILNPVRAELCRGFLLFAALIFLILHYQVDDKGSERQHPEDDGGISGCKGFVGY